MNVSLSSTFGRLLAVSLLLAVGSAVLAADPPAAKPNVLFIAIDDLKPAIGCYGDRLAKTPNIDRLAARGTVFERAYCMQAVCSPSRNAILTGLRPETLRIYDLGTNFRKRAPEVVTLPQHFKSQGYQSHGLGKIFHVGHGNNEDARSWSVPHFQAKTVQYVLPENKAQLTREEALFGNKKGNVNQLPKGAAYEKADVPDEEYADGRIAAEAIKRLQGFKESGQPFFLAVGFLKPHLPFCAPKKYWDMHDPAKLPQPQRSTPPEGAPSFAPQFGGELRNYANMPAQGPIPEETTRTLIHGYYAASSYMDAQLGRVLDELDRLGLAENTIIALWGDHGWHLGDHGMWCKHTNYEQATRAPLIVSAPGKKGGQHTRALAEFVDVYPTLCDLAGVPRPDHLQGESLVPLMNDPNSAGKAAAFQVYPRRTPQTGPLLGHAVRTDHWRYVEWRKANESVAARELYDLQDDPGETVNLAAKPEQAAVVAEHSKLLAARLAKQPPKGLKLLDLAQADPAPARPAGRERPNIVVFLSDDLSQADCSVYGSKDLQTPNMRRLAEAGMTFTQAYVASPSCAPSRAALLTGLMPARNGAEANHSKPREEIRKLPAYLQELGYEVVMFGKVAHYNHGKFYGFDRAEFEGFHDHRGIAAAAELLASRDAGKSRPLCLFVGTNWPHRPWPDDEGGYNPAKLSVPATHVDTDVTRKFRARYYHAVAKADEDLGVIYDAAIKHLGKDTLFIFTSDHGAQWPFGKWNCYEEGLRVPLIVSWSGVVQPRTRTDAMVSWIDLLPTLVAAAAGQPPKSGNATGEIDGRSFLAVLRGESQQHRERIFGTHSGDRGMNVYPIRSLRQGNWKYIWNLHPEYKHTTHVDRAQAEDEVGYFRSWERAAAAGDKHAAAVVKRYHARPAAELYNLEADPLEQHNLAADPALAQRVKAMHAELAAWMDEQGDQRTVFNKPVLLAK